MSYRISILDAGKSACRRNRRAGAGAYINAGATREAWLPPLLVAEHHNTDQLAKPSPSWLSPAAGWAPGGSVLGPAALQHHSPSTAENFNQAVSRLAASISGSARRRGRFSTRALQQACTKRRKDLADQLAQLDNWLSLTEPGRGEPTRHADPASPGRWFSARRQPGG